MMDAERLYRGEQGAQYFAQRGTARSLAAQKSRARRFAGFTSTSDVVLDFGCGTGGILANLPAARRIGVEISEHARAEAETKLDRVVDALAEIETGSVDRVLSYHALEHVESPSAILKDIRRVLRPDGRVKILVPCDTPMLSSGHRSWAANPEMHLHSWTPRTLGNLLTVCGFTVLEARMLPDSDGGRLGARLAEGSLPRAVLAYLKAFRASRFHTCVMGEVAPRP
jgi:SAM-dependent methyltransferase